MSGLFVQNQILCPLSQPESVARLEWMGADGSFETRADLGGQSVKPFSFLMPTVARRSARAVGPCRSWPTAARLTWPRSGPGSDQARTRAQAVPPPAGRPNQVHQVRGLSIILLEIRAQREQWNTWLMAEHPRGAKRLLGFQLPYLIHRDHGYLGAVGFAAVVRCRSPGTLGWTGVRTSADTGS